MQQDLLRSSDVTKIFLIYESNNKKFRESVSLCFLDNKACYLKGGQPANFVKPKKKTPAELKIYTSNGVYNTTVSLLDVNLSLNNGITYEVTLPKTWNFVQLRASSRKQVKLPVNVQFNDGFLINAETFDISLGGVSFYHNEPIPSIYKKLSGILTIVLPKNTIIDFPNGHMTVETKFVREKSTDDNNDNFYIFKFLNVQSEDLAVLKHFIMSIN